MGTQVEIKVGWSELVPDGLPRNEKTKTKAVTRTHNPITVSTLRKTFPRRFIYLLLNNVSVGCVIIDRAIGTDRTALLRTLFHSTQ